MKCRDLLAIRCADTDVPSPCEEASDEEEEPSYISLLVESCKGVAIAISMVEGEGLVANAKVGDRRVRLRGEDVYRFARLVLGDRVLLDPTVLEVWEVEEPPCKVGSWVSEFGRRRRLYLRFGGVEIYSIPVCVLDAQEFVKLMIDILSSKETCEAAIKRLDEYTRDAPRILVIERLGERVRNIVIIPSDKIAWRMIRELVKSRKLGLVNLTLNTLLEPSENSIDAVAIYAMPDDYADYTEEIKARKTSIPIVSHESIRKLEKIWGIWKLKETMRKTIVE